MNFLPSHTRYDGEAARAVRERRRKAALRAEAECEAEERTHGTATDEELVFQSEHDWAGLTSESSSDFEAVSESELPSSSSRRQSQAGDAAPRPATGNREPSPDDGGATPHHSPGHRMDLHDGSGFFPHPRRSIASPVFGVAGGNGGEESDSSTSFDPQAWKIGERGTGGSRRHTPAAGMSAMAASSSDAEPEARPSSPDTALAEPRGRTRSRSIGSSAFRDDPIARGNSSPPIMRAEAGVSGQRMSNLSALLHIHSAPTASASTSRSEGRPSFSMQRQDTYRASSQQTTSQHSLGLSQPAVHEVFVSAAASQAIADDDEDYVHEEEDAPLQSSVASLQSLPGTDTEFVSSADEGVQLPPPSYPSSRPVDIASSAASTLTATTEAPTHTQSLYLPTSPASAPTGLSTSPRKALGRHHRLPKAINLRPRSATSPYRSASDLGVQGSPTASTSTGFSRRGRRPRRRRSPSSNLGGKSRRRAGEARMSADEAELEAAEASAEFLQALENLRVMASFGKARPLASPSPGEVAAPLGTSSSGTVLAEGGPGVVAASTLGVKAVPRPQRKSSDEGPAYADDPTSDEGLARAEAGHGSKREVVRRATAAAAEKEKESSEKEESGRGRGKTGWWSWLGGSWTMKTWQVVGIVGIVLGVGIGAGSLLSKKRLHYASPIFSVV